MPDFNTLKKNLEKDFSDLKVIRIAILSDSSTQHLVQAIKGYGFEVGANFVVYETTFNWVDQLVFDSSSELYKYKPNYVVIFNSTERLISKFYNTDKATKINFATDHIAWLKNVYNIVTDKLSAKIIYLNFPEINDSVFGNYSNKVELSFPYQLRKLNYELMGLSSGLSNLYICDLSAIQNQMGRSFLGDPKMYVHADMVLSLDALPLVAKNITDIICACNGNFKKCLILDLDNVMWGGVLGDDGIENIQIGNLGIGKAFTELQLWFRQLRERGIILSVCSNNEETIAREPFEKHPEMILRLDDIAVFVANRGSKVDNIKYIQQVLNIGFESIIFLDDDPFERNLVRTYIPGIEVPELPEDPANYLEYLRTLNLFETVSFTNEDEQRTSHYQEQAKRIENQQEHINEADFLIGLGMVSDVEPVNKFNIPRVAQLSQRSNQFNLRTVRYTEREIEELSTSENHEILTFTLDDKFGKNGLVCAIILKKQGAKNLFINNWLMSCRVLKRGMENFVLNNIVKFAEAKGFDRIIGEYIPTAKNNLVKDHYKGLGFTSSNGFWILNTESYHERISFICSI